MLTVATTVCIVGGTLIGLPQVIHLLRSRSSAGLSLLAWYVWSGGAVAWLVHGLLILSPAQIIPNTVGVVTATLVLRLIQHDRGLAWGRSYAPALMLAAAGIAVRLLFGPLAFGLFMSVPQGIAVLGQFVDIVRCRDLRGVSPVYLGLMTLVQANWIVYGLLQPDVAAFVSSLVLTTTTAASLLWWALRRVGWIGPLWPVVEAL